MNVLCTLTIILDPIVDVCFLNSFNFIQVPASVDRALAMTSVTGGPGLPNTLTEDYESKQALSIAQSTVTSLRDRLAQKEETLEK